MRVVLAAGKRGHYYLTARALRQAGVLSRFITSTFFPSRSWRRKIYPERRIAVRSDPELDGAPVVSLWPVELGYRAARAAGWGGRRLTRIYNRCFDWSSAPFVRGGDVFHVATTYALRSAAAARRAGMRVVLDQQAVHPRYLREDLPKIHARLGLAPPRTDRRILGRIEQELKGADLILTPSPFVRDENVRAGIPVARQRVVPIGVDTRLFRPAARPARAGGPLRVLFVGTLHASKGITLLRDAAQRLGPDRVRLRVIGAGAAPAGVAKLGPLPHAKLASEYRRADVFCLPSFAEGSALVVYEAMASGLPCVVTPAAGTVVQHDKDGWIVPTGDVDALAAALEQLLDDADLRERLGRAARATACRCYDVAQYGRRLIDAYEGA